MQQPCCVYTTWLLFAAVAVGFCYLLLATVAVGFCFVFAAIFLWFLLCAWLMYPEFALCFFQDDISDPYAS